MARDAVISNAPIWETSSLLPTRARDLIRGSGGSDEKSLADILASMVSSSKPLDGGTPATPSFMHLHLGIRAEGLDMATLKSIHHINVPAWSELTKPQSAAFVSVPSLLDPSLAPEGFHTIHAYLPATEPYAVWGGHRSKERRVQGAQAQARPAIVRRDTQIHPGRGREDRGGADRIAAHARALPEALSRNVRAGAAGGQARLSGSDDAD